MLLASIDVKPGNPNQRHHLLRWLKEDPWGLLERHAAEAPGCRERYCSMPRGFMADEHLASMDPAPGWLRTAAWFGIPGLA